MSVESIHHFTQEQKTALYHKVYSALKAEGCFILTDYFATSEEEEIFYRQELLRLKEQQGIADDEFYHYDTLLTMEHEMQALKEAGFLSVEILGHWENTYTLRVRKAGV